MRRASWALLVCSIVAVVGVALTTTPFDPNAACCDHLFYRSMAYNLFTVTRPSLNAPPPGNSLPQWERQPAVARYMSPVNALNRQPPFIYRPVAPLVARLLAIPLGGIDRGFYALSLIGLIVAAYFLALAAWHLSGDIWPAVATIAAFVAIPTVARTNLFDYMLVDPLAFACLSVGVWAMLTRRDRLFWVVALVGIFTKETQAFVIAAYLLQAAWERRLTWRVGAAALVTGGLYGSYRLLLPVPVNTYSLRTTFLGVPHPAVVLGVALGVFGVLGPLAALRCRRVPFSLWLLPIVAGTFVIPLFAVNADRAYVFAFPFVLLAVFGVRPIGRLDRAATLLAGGVFVVMEVTATLVGPQEALLTVVVALLLIATCLGAQWSGRDRASLVPASA
ncbi:MAG TPA: hypothetical protein VFN57_15670 [Thermomicrobiaceae bacterium]|nr:hypothetical protein [Thermomicrobiaceae bacterium]